ncbi:HlyD family type I secretion periplasmic adaptor subunit [Kushneria indalinina]|uniref:Membrane fusion protein (MFP) family protein n=1 Tax=Kushneria indalinina DSM 14324 TaxID=1122140 RepID=A0A3D9DV81_9GAMM|nr:HlyD family type I secretion periplasmic adaptor subunit [Kushneria indalinina]REC94299.1 epimerase transport system membrane fusion protein [Kushneria indalinina DSM 14324]
MSTSFSTTASSSQNTTSQNTPSLPISDRGARRTGIVIVLVAFGIFGGWAMLANLAVAVVATGTVSVESFKKTVQHLEGGIVSQINVDDGDHVEAGDVLMVLDATQARSQYAIARTGWFIASAQEARLMAEQQQLEQLEFPPALLEMAQKEERLQQVLNVQRSLFFSRRQALQGELEGLDEQNQQLREQIAGLEQTMRINSQRIASLSDEADDYRALFREGLGNNQRVRELERQRMQLDSDSASSKAQIAQLRSRISENRVQMETRRQSWQQEVGEGLRQAQSEIGDTSERMTALSDQMRRTELRAPVAGTVVGLETHTLGAVIEPGKPVMSIVPNAEGFLIDTRIAAQDIDNIYVGQPAEIRFSAFNQRRSSVVEGELVNVSADSFQDESTGESYYRGRVRVSETGQESMSDEEMQLLSGMPAEVMLRTGEKTLMGYVMQPVTDMLARAVRQD